MDRPQWSKSARAIHRATRRPGRFPHASAGMLAWLMFVWVLLWGDLSAGNFLAGLLVALLVTTVAPFPATPFDGRFRPLGVAHLAVRFLWDIIVSSFQQGKFILTGGQPQAAIIRIHLRSHSDVYLAMISGMTALVPGSVVVEAHRVTGTLYVHVFDTRLAGGIEGVHKTVLELEERVLRAFASHDELVDAGYVPGSTPRAGRLPTPYAPPTGEPITPSITDDVSAALAKKAKRDERAERMQRIAGNTLQAEVDQ
ncbi:Na+/H+ antiporter subunit E [Trueperella bialowiezensis]|uniref:Putative monovalent cation/H+ antiporter subunit E n=1 Tax=Trueperella bialowiezensis TaxID=312285 RepID=A0A448PF22_9ACTO|nr:Na+/H+ antiporter subunit E [Trueperella bialowiezensis]VEI13532.1 putative monovalent cation/H+ antiporter subunit E [Trueperella bialowiezensis]